MNNRFFIGRIAPVLLFFSVCMCKNAESAGHGQQSDATQPFVTDKKQVPADTLDSVWVCESPGARKYHANRQCSGLKNCKHHVRRKLRAEAEAIGFTSCRKNKCN